MATYKKLLKNRAGDNIIPVIEDISTDEIEDEAVTSPKIDFTTITSDMNNMPMVYNGCNIGYGVVVNLRRVGNMVWCTQESIVTSAITGDITSCILGETIPYGYRPCAGTSIHSQFQDGSLYNATWRITTSGQIILTTRGNYGAIRIGINAFWFTNNAWPSS